MSVSPALLRQRAATAVSDISASWREVPHAFELYTLRELPEMQHLGFAIGVPSTEALPDDRRQRRGASEGVLARTELVCRFAYNLRSEGHVVDTDGAVAAELAAVAAVAGMVSTDASPPRLVRVTRTTSTSESKAVRIVDLFWSILHTYPLA